jgi:3-methyladenine DNA glycosylase AlkD
MLTPASTAEEIIAHLKSLGSEVNRQGMKRYGIRIERALGISHGTQRSIAKAIERDHERAMLLWDSGITEAQFIASLTADPKRMTLDTARAWAASFDSWDIVDGVSDLFVNMPEWRQLIVEFASDEREFVRRTAFAMLAWGSVHRKKDPDTTFEDYLKLIRKHSADSRNYVWKAVSWALRSIGKRSMHLRNIAATLSEELAGSTDRTSARIGRDAAKELNDAKTIAAIERREANRSKRMKHGSG